MPKKHQKNVQIHNSPKVTNPCKICSNTVTQKTGLQCKGACHTWMHYDCLNYTPGRIKDIEAGLIKVTCPCPDCKNGPKEYRTDEVNCDIPQCPANKPPVCGKPSCLATQTEKMNQTSELICPSTCESKCKSSNVLKDPQDSRPFNTKQQQATASSSYAGLRESECVPNFPGDSNKGTQGDSDMTMTAMEQMCKTVGVLSQQLKEIMVKMQQHAKSRAVGNANLGSGVKCPKPCHCPNNPRSK